MRGDYNSVQVNHTLVSACKKFVTFQSEDYFLFCSGNGKNSQEIFQKCGSLLTQLHCSALLLPLLILISFDQQQCMFCFTHNVISFRTKRFFHLSMAGRVEVYSDSRIVVQEAIKLRFHKMTECRER